MNLSNNDDVQFRKKLNEKSNGEYSKFVHSLKVKYTKVYFDVFLGYFFLALTLFLSALLVDKKGHYWFGIISFFGIGFFLHYLALFLHEGSHFNLAKSKKLNDIFSFWFGGWVIGQTVDVYRKTHFDHHRYLGTDKDPENSYFEKLELSNIILCLLGVKGIVTLLKKGREDNQEKEKKKVSLRALKGIFLGAGTYFVIFLALILTKNYISAGIWMLAALSSSPLIGVVRQTLEHRPGKLDSKKFESVTRNFSKNIFSKFLGGAGFDSHLLHHREPNVSYTNFDELEAYILSLTNEPIKRRSYSSTFKKIFGV